jgi:hypothetical protein
VQHLVDTIGAYAEAGLHHLVGVPSLTVRHPTTAAERLEATIEDLQRGAAEVLPAVR